MGEFKPCWNCDTVSSKRTDGWRTEKCDRCGFSPWEALKVLQERTIFPDASNSTALRVATENVRLTAEVECWRGAALELWMLLDAIDTAEDVAKDDDAWFRRRAHHLHQQRHTRVSSDDPAWEADGRDWSKFDALAREDGVG